MASLAMASNTPAAIHLSRRTADGGVGDLVGAEAFGVFPGAAGGETYEHHGEAVSVGCAWPVAAEGMAVNGHRHERFDCRPDRIYHFGVERAHDG